MRVTNGDAQIDVRIDGDDGETIVLLHGFPLAKEIWNAQAERLASAFRVVRLDLRGMGASSIPDGPYLMETLAGDVAAVLDAIGSESTSIAGHSAGGYVALAFARMYTERVKRLALICSRLQADSPEQARARFELADRADGEGRIDAVVSTYVPRLTAPQTASRQPEIVERLTAIAQRTSPHGAAAFLRGIALRSASDDIAPELTMPVLALFGEADAIVSLDEAHCIARAFPNAESAIAGHSGHVPMLEEPEYTSAALGEWMRR